MKKNRTTQGPTSGTETTEKAEHRPRLLIVDDSESSRAAICDHVSHEQFDYDEAENGAVAVEKTKTDRYDLILMDIRMPMMDGYEAMRRIRQWEESRGLARTPIIAFTASSFEEDVQKAIASGADLHVAKPVKRDALATAIKSLIPAEARQGNVSEKRSATQ